MFLGYFVAQILNPSLCDVPLYVRADVCPSLTNASQREIPTMTSTEKTETLLRTIHRSQRSSDLETLRPVTTATRIPLLSP
jgi:hypothetical protein